MLTQTRQGALATSTDFESRADTYGAKLSEIERAILTTVTYRDLFDYPVTLAEIHRYLHGVQCEPETVQDALQRNTFAERYLESDGEYFALKGRDRLFDLRRTREKRAEELWSTAVRHGAVLAGLPFVRMVAVTGSLAVNNPGHGADTDFMLVTDGGRLWTVRMLAKLLQLLNSRFAGGELCVNHLVTTRALELADPSLYVAQELTQMVPLFGADTYASLRAHNNWSTNFLPNADGPPPVQRHCKPRASSLRGIAQRLFRSRLGDSLESWECRRKLHKYNTTEFLLGRSSPFSAEATGHRRTNKEIIEAAFDDRLKGPREHRNNLRVLFGQAYHLSLDAKLWRAMQPFPPLGSLYAAAVARSLGHNVRVHDSMLTVSPGEWSAAIQVNDPDVVVLYEDNFNYLTKMCLLSMRNVALNMISVAKNRGARVVICSSDATDEPQVYLEAGADFVLAGEGEDTFADVLRLINEDYVQPPQDIPGLVFLSSDGELVRTAARPVMRHIDELPLPAWDLIDIRRYHEIWTRRHGRLSLNLATTRGCPYHCNWCAKPIWGQRYNSRSPENVVDELALLQDLVDVNYFWFMDDIFGLKPHWVSRFAEVLEDTGINIRFKSLSRPDLLLRKGETGALARAGCDIAWMGAESGSQKVLDAMEKGTTVENILDACASLRQHGIRVGLFIQFGYPGETWQDIQATIRMIRKIMPDELGISVSYPLPGTRFYDRVKAELGSTRNWQDSDDLAMLFNGPFNTPFYRSLHRYVHSDLNMRRAWRFLSGSRGQKTVSSRIRLRKTGLLAYSVVRVACFGFAMAILSRLPHRGINSLPVELRPDAAATPSDQSAD